MTEPILLVTGLSGAGKSTALRALEDAGFEVVDNLPLSLLRPLVAAPTGRPLAVGIDTRTRAFDPAALLEGKAALSSPARPVHLLFLDCSGAELVRRFGETRRRHPLAIDRPAADGIARERELLADLRRQADLVVDTTDYSVHELRRALLTRLGRGDAVPMTLTILSFAYSRGVPRDADLVFDMRFLRNPHWDPALRPLDGTDPAVAAFVAADPRFAPVFAQILGLLRTLLPGYAEEGRAYVTIAFGCTGGRHRSVALAEKMGQALAEDGWANLVQHRDRASAVDEAAFDPRSKDFG
jgi:UPF0042 nucleotide-binding protein